MPAALSLRISRSVPTAVPEISTSRVGEVSPAGGAISSEGDQPIAAARGLDISEVSADEAVRDDVRAGWAIGGRLEQRECVFGVLQHCPAAEREAPAC